MQLSATVVLSAHQKGKCAQCETEEPHMSNSVEQRMDISAGEKCTLWSVNSRRRGWKKTHSLKCGNQN